MENDKVVGEIIKGFSSKSIERAKGAVSHMNEKTSNFKVPYLITDEDTRRYINELDLNNPQKLVTFLVEVGYSAVEVINDSINEIKIDMMNDCLSGLKSIKQQIRHSIGEADSYVNLRNYQDQLIDLRNKLEARVSENIQRIIRIDNMSSFERKVKALFIRNNVDSYTIGAQRCLQAVMEIVKLQIFIADYIGDKRFYTIRNDIDEFMNEVVFNSNNILIMNDWATKENRNYWSDRLRKEYAQIMEQQDGLLEFFTDIRNMAEEKKVDLENIIFE